jgi:uncharacterized protein YkwD
MKKEHFDLQWRKEFPTMNASLSEQAAINRYGKKGSSPMFIRQRIFAYILMLAAASLSAAPAHGATASEIQQWLDDHNSKRQLHQVGPVTWSATVAASAQNYADTCPSGHSGSGYGENLAWSTYQVSIETVTSWWYSEESQYDYAKPGWQSGTGHFTQMVWKGTTEIGCGMAQCSSGKWPYVWVCQYNPPGNVIGTFTENVFPPQTQPAPTPPPPEKKTIVQQLFLLLH